MKLITEQGEINNLKKAARKKRNYFSENYDIKNVSLSLSNVIDTKGKYHFWLKIDGK